MSFLPSVQRDKGFSDPTIKSNVSGISGGDFHELRSGVPVKNNKSPVAQTLEILSLEEAGHPKYSDMFPSATNQSAATEALPNNQEIRM